MWDVYNETKIFQFKSYKYDSYNLLIVSFFNILFRDIIKEI